MNLRTLPAALAAALILATGAAWANDVPLNDPVKEAEIRAVLEKDGYEVRSVGTIDGKFEVYATKNGKAWEIFLDQMLMVVETNPAKG